MMPKGAMPTQPSQKRAKNFSEVALGFSKKQAVEEALRCPQPLKPEHSNRCPLGVDVFSFIRFIREGNLSAALEKIKEANPLPGVCGRICSAPCEKDLYENEHWSVAVRGLERYVADNVNQKIKKNSAAAFGENGGSGGRKVAVIGSGPAGLVAAHDLARLGYTVTIFEALHASGGVLRYGIPEFRLPKKVLDNEIMYIQSLGIKIETNVFIGQTITIDELFKSGFAAVYLATGSGVPVPLGIPGENLPGVFSMSEFLMRVNLAQPLKLGKKVAVIGSGGIGVDCARVALRLGCEVVVVFERSEEELTPQEQELKYAKEEGVKFEFFTKPLEILAGEGNRTRGVRCVKVDFADPHSTGEWKLVTVEGSEFVLDADTIVVSSGHKPNTFVSKFTDGLKVIDSGVFEIQENSFATSVPGVFAGGDAAIGAGPLIKAMASAKKAVLEIDQYLKTKKA